MSSFDLQGEGRVALITGAATGLGRAIGEVFAEAGYRLALVDIDADGGEATAAALRERTEVLFHAADISDQLQVQSAIAAALASYDQLDLVVNNAGVLGPQAAIEDLEEDDLDHVLGVNLRGPFLVCKYAVQAFKNRGGGGIVNIGSITSESGAAYYPSYSVSKLGLVALTRSIARRVGRYNIRVNCINPGSIQGTEFNRGKDLSSTDKLLQAAALAKKIPLGRAASPRDLAHVVLFLASPLARHVHGAVLTVDGGESLGYQ